MISPFKDACRGDAPNFIPSNAKSQEIADIRESIQKARPPTPPRPKTEIPSKKSSHMKLDGKYAYLQPSNDEIIKNTSLDSIETDQIFMTYTENDKTTSDDFANEMKQNQMFVDEEIKRIKDNLQLPTVETEEDARADEEVKYSSQGRWGEEFQWEDDRPHHHSQEMQQEFNDKTDFKSPFNPLMRKIILLEYDPQADLAEAKHVNSCSGFILAPTLKFTKIQEGDYEADGIIQHKDNELILQKLVNSSILKSFNCTPINSISCGFEH